ncbi:hypothetical protein [Rossellomorea marisflavi]|uniref:hypothetical protein n=1 Tax=Rossellomorea marisflavi TaxID=189381 RepID=UPI00345742D2
MNKEIRPVRYGIQSHILTTLSLLKQAEELLELFMKSHEEIKLWRMLRRLTSRVSMGLDNMSMDQAQKVLAYQIGHVEVLLNLFKRRIEVLQNDKILEVISLEMLRKQPAQTFKLIKESVYM